MSAKFEKKGKVQALLTQDSVTGKGKEYDEMLTYEINCPKILTVLFKQLKEQGGGFKSTEVDTILNSKAVDGKWTFVVIKCLKGPLTVIARYQKVNTPLAVELDVKLDVFHRKESVWSGMKHSGGSVITQQRVCQAGTSTQAQNQAEDVIINSYCMYWNVDPVILSKLIRDRFKSPNLNFKFTFNSKHQVVV